MVAYTLSCKLVETRVNGRRRKRGYRKNREPALMNSRRTVLIGVLLLLVAQWVVPAGLGYAAGQAPHTAPSDTEKEPTQEERMNRRYPQPVRVGDLIGLPVLDWEDLTIGHVRNV